MKDINKIIIVISSLMMSILQYSWANTPPTTLAEIKKALATTTNGNQSILTVSDEANAVKQCFKTYQLSENNLLKMMEVSTWQSQITNFQQAINTQLTQCLVVQMQVSDLTKKKQAIIQIDSINQYLTDLITGYSDLAQDKTFVVPALAQLKQAQSNGQDIAQTVLKSEQSESENLIMKFKQGDPLTPEKTEQAVREKNLKDKDIMASCMSPYGLSYLQNLANETEEKIIKNMSVHIDYCLTALRTGKVNNSETVQKKVTTQLKAIKDKLHDNLLLYTPASNAPDQAKLIRKLKNIDNNLHAKIDQGIDDDEIEYILPPWREESFSYQFYAGIEATTLNKFMEETNARVGFQGYKRFTRNLERLKAFTNGQCELNTVCHDWGFDLHVYGNLVLTAESEHTFVTAKTDSSDIDTNSSVVMANNSTDNENDPNDEQEVEVTQALISEFGLFMPVYMSIDGDVDTVSYQEFMAGPIITAGLSFTDDSQDHFKGRYYLGVRLAHNEESYLDILYGKHEGIKGRRMEIRGQLPVTTIAGGRIFIGGKANFGIDRHKNNTEDAWQAYLQWQTSFDSLWEKFKQEE